MTITHALPADQYHAIRAVSAGMVHVFDSDCPAKAFAASPWNPARVEKDTNAFDIGRAAHLAVLEPADLADRVVLVSADVLSKNGAYGTTEAKEIRDQAWRDGMTPLKPDEWKIVGEIARAIEGSAAAPLFQGGNAEVTMQWEWSVAADRRCWRWPECKCETCPNVARAAHPAAVPCKLRADYIPDDLSYVVDLKTCDSANPEAAQRAIYNFGYHVRASWYLAGVEAATGKRPDRYLFVLIEKKPVGMVTVYELDQRALDRGDKIIAKTLPRIAECLKTGEWPGYPGGLIGLPTWAEFKYADGDEEVG